MFVAVVERQGRGLACNTVFQHGAQARKREQIVQKVRLADNMAIQHDQTSTVPLHLLHLRDVAKSLQLLGFFLSTPNFEKVFTDYRC
jgi:hypothetical protein